MANRWWEMTAYGVVAVSGLPLIYAAFRGLVCEHRITSALLITIAMAACIIIGEVFAAGEIAFIMALGELLEERTVQRARRGIMSLASLMPGTARCIRGDSAELIATESVRPGDLIRVLPGENIPADGIIESGFSSVNQASITGESLPVDKGVGDKVYTGTLNGYGSLDVRATCPGTDTTLQQLVRLVNEAEAHPSPFERTVDKWAGILVPAALILAILVYLFTGDIERGVTILVVFCPCALALATPTCIVAAIGQATQKGVLIKSGEALERLARVGCFAFDKTGTLTRGELKVSEVLPLRPGVDATQLLTLAAGVEARSEHPIAKAIVQHAREKGLRYAEATDFRMIPGMGAEGTLHGVAVSCGRYCPEQLTEHEQLAVETALSPLRRAGHATLVVLQDGALVGVISLSDSLRPETPAAIQALQTANARVAMLTGDHAQCAAAIAGEAGIREWHADLLPADKLAVIAEIEQNGTPVCMVGDGVNDAPALHRASIGISMGGMAGNIAHHAADISLMSSDLSRIPYLYRLAKATLSTIKFNISMALLINAAAIVLSIYGLLGPVSGALVHNAGSVLVVLHAALLYERRFDVNHHHPTTSPTA